MYVILINKIMDRLNSEKAFASSVKIVPRIESPVCHTSLFFMRHKIMLALEDLKQDSPAMDEEVVEVDVTYVPESEKGIKFEPTSR